MPLYKQDPDNTSKQIPDVRGDNRNDRQLSPGRCVVTKTPNSIIIGPIAGDVGFFFGSSASFAVKAELEGRKVGVAGGDNGTIPTGSLSASKDYVQYGSPADGTTFNIHPTAYSSSLADVGKVFFVYNSGLSTGPR